MKFLSVWAGEQIKDKYQRLPFKNYQSELLIFNVYILGAHVHIHIKYEVSIFNPAARGLCTDAE